MSNSEIWTVRGPVNDGGLVYPRVEIMRSANGRYTLDYYAEYARFADHTSAFTFRGAKRKARRIIKRKLKFREAVAKEWKKKS